MSNNLLHVFAIPRLLFTCSSPKIYVGSIEIQSIVRSWTFQIKRFYSRTGSFKVYSGNQRSLQLHPITLTDLQDIISENILRDIVFISLSSRPPYIDASSNPVSLFRMKCDFRILCKYLLSCLHPFQLLALVKTRPERNTSLILCHQLH